MNKMDYFNIISQITIILLLVYILLQFNHNIVLPLPERIYLP